jgi:hypothetical protein
MTRENTRQPKRTSRIWGKQSLSYLPAHQLYGSLKNVHKMTGLNAVTLTGIPLVLQLTWTFTRCRKWTLSYPTAHELYGSLNTVHTIMQLTLPLVADTKVYKSMQLNPLSSQRAHHLYLNINVQFITCLRFSVFSSTPTLRQPTQFFTRSRN